MPIDETTVRSDSVREFAEGLQVDHTDVIPEIDANAQKYKDYEGFVKTVNKYTDKSIDSPDDVKPGVAFSVLVQFLGPIPVCNYIVEAADGEYDVNFNTHHHSFVAKRADD